MVGIADFFALAQQAGIFHFYLPFVLVFAIFYGLLTKSKVFGDPKQDKTAVRLNAIISLVAALYVIGFTPVGVQLISFADYLATLFTDAAVVIVTLLVFLMILWMLIPIKTAELSKWWYILVVIAALIALALFFNAGGSAIFGFVGNIGGGIGLSGQDIAIIVLIVITVLVIYWLTRGESSGDGGGAGGQRTP